MPKKILIIYHGDCFDGFGGAWAAWKKFGEKAEYLGAQRGVPPPDVRGREVYCIDFTYEPESVLKKIAEDAARFVLIDHHISARLKMEIAPEFWFSLENSASVLAWKYFHPNEPVPFLLKYIEDGDLWKFKLPHSKEIGSYLGLFEFKFKTWEKAARELESDAGRKEAFEKGKLLLKQQNEFVKHISKYARTIKFAGKKVLAVNSPIFESELGHELARKKPPFAIIWSERDGKIKVSLRSNGEYDVSKLAEKYGGGGHKAASGFSVPAGKVPWGK